MMAKIPGHFNRVIQQIVSGDALSIDEISILPEEEKQRVLYEFNDTATLYPGDKTIHGLFEDQVQRTPHLVAVTGPMIGLHSQNSIPNRASVTYSQLNRMAGRLARVLIEQGLRADRIAAIMLERSIEMIIGIFGILKAGGAYLPIESSYPTERIDFMLRDSGAMFLLKSEIVKHENPKCETNFNDQISNEPDKNQCFPYNVLNFEEFTFHNVELVGSQHDFQFRASNSKSSNLAYVIYTSGSTGRPKGVMVEHQGLVNYIHWGMKQYRNGKSSIFPLYTSISFDLTVTSIFLPLIRGNRVIIYQEDENQLAVFKVLEEGIADIIKLTPSHLSILVMEMETTNQRMNTLIVGGEKLETALAFDSHNKFNGKPTIYNEYGPTEATVGCMIYEFKTGYLEERAVPIGKPIANAKIYLLDNYLKPVPINVSGEVYIGGVVVARGYLNQAELTSDRFLENPFVPGERIYKTGDLAKRFPDGNIQFLGRKNDQVKIRGFRVELGEIENRLLTHPDIKDVVVIARGDEQGDRYLCAYVVYSDPSVVHDLREYLATDLPGYMIPSYFIRIDLVPLTPNGKVDRKALPAPEAEAGDDYVAPRDFVENQLVVLWSEVLGIEPSNIGIDSKFFALGGHSLKATGLVSKIHQALNVKVPLTEVFRTPTIRQLAKYIHAAARERYAAIEPAEKREYYGLSSAQKRLYIIHQMDLESTAYNMPQFIPFEKIPSLEKLEEAFTKMINRHESLRTSFHMIDNQPVQKVHDHVEFSIERRAQGAGRSILEPFVHPFDLSHAPLLRVGLAETSGGAHILMVDMHHIISDGVSRGLMTRDFMALYDGKPLVPLPLQYKDFAQWQNHPSIKQTLRSQEEYWLKRFDHDIPVLDLPTDYARPPVQIFEGETISFALDRQDSLMLKELASIHEASIFMVLLAVFNILLSKVSGNGDIIIGTGTAGRMHDDLSGIIGMFINTLPLKNTPRPNQTFPELLEGIKKNSLNDFENQDYPFEDLVEKLNLKRDTSRNPLFDVMFQFNNFEVSELKAPRLDADPYDDELKASKFDLTLWGWEGEEDLTFTFEYSTQLFKRETIEVFIRYFKGIVDAVTRDARAANQTLWEIQQMSPQAKEALLLEMNQALEAENRHMLKYGQIIQQPLNESLTKLKFRDKIALEYGTLHLSYAELDRRSNRVAHQLAAMGVKKGSFTGLLMEDRALLVLTIIGVLKARGVFVVLDHSLPQSRLEFMVESTQMEFIFTDKANSNFIADSESLKQPPLELTFVHHLPGGKNGGKNGEDAPSPEEPPAIHYQPEDQIYVYFTSGSTGTPKAIVGKNIGLLHFIQWEIDTLDIGSTPGDTVNVSQLISPGFDAFLRDLFVPLFTGGRLCIPPDPDITRDSGALTHWLSRSRINVLHCVPSLFRQLEIDPSNGENYKNLNYVLLSGEKINASDLIDWYDQVNRLEDKITFINLYGPTETTMTKTYHVIRKEDLKRPRIPVGKPMPGVGIMVLDENMNWCDPLVTGDIYIRTPYATHGYYNDPQLNKAKFLEYPFSPNAPKSSTLRPAALYKTGDRGKVLPDGSLDLMGRNDRQVKMRGIRIELGEVETLLSRHPLVKEAAVIKKEQPNHPSRNEFLCAFVTAKTVPGAADGDFVETIARYLKERLPSYMVPSQILAVADIPRTPSGKTDYKTLAVVPEEKERHVSPGSPVEQKLLKLWTGILKSERISATDNFFTLGGNSLNVMNLISAIHREFDVRIPLADIFNGPTIQKQAALINPQTSTTPAEKYSAIQPVEKRDYYPMSSAQKRLYFLQRMDMEGTVYNMPFAIPMGKDVEKDKLETILTQLIHRHESLRTSFHMVNEEPVQRVHDDVPFEIEYVGKGVPLWSPLNGNHAGNIDSGSRNNSGSHGGLPLRNFARPFDLSQ
ncbi:MAG: amino acid adenylation domain-containing protein, partial [bacterium]|nr:amino acid adenylation domain-containing protein [bacterium]